jgi:hypothetical protein
MMPEGWGTHKKSDRSKRVPARLTCAVVLARLLILNEIMFPHLPFHSIYSNNLLKFAYQSWFPWMYCYDYAPP